jgi:phosphopantothenoylcysteine decarboxylase/phosphopantothenate--cysteine ligase
VDGHRLKGRQVAVGVGGGIAAYKACDLVRELMRTGARVRVAMTQGATRFVAPLTFQALSGNPVLTDLFDPRQDAGFGHLDLSRWAELYVVAPATADLLARIRAGMADDAVTTSVVACRCPILLAPAMNVAMWENRLTQENVQALLAEPRYSSVGPEVGLLADGEVGAGRLAPVARIVQAAEAALAQGPMAGRRVLITAGPTREYLDPVRFMSNPSSGKMGLALAQVARGRGADVTVVLGPVASAERDGLDVVDVTSAEEMAREVLSRVEATDFFVAAAAVSDYRPVARAPQKIKKTEAPEAITFVRTPDVLAEASRRVAAAAHRPVLVGFAAETEHLVENARAKLAAKGLDFVIANDVSKPGSGFAADDNEVVVIPRQGETRTLRGPKRQVAAEICDALTGAHASL